MLAVDQSKTWQARRREATYLLLGTKLLFEMLEREAWLLVIEGKHAPVLEHAEVLRTIPVLGSCAFPFLQQVLCSFGVAQVQLV